MSKTSSPATGNAKPNDRQSIIHSLTALSNHQAILTAHRTDVTGFSILGAYQYRIRVKRVFSARYTSRHTIALKQRGSPSTTGRRLSLSNHPKESDLTMQQFFRVLFWFLARVLARLRYRVRVVGGEKLRGLYGPTLVMPNHPGYIDPPLVLSHLPLAGRRFARVVTRAMYRNPVLYPMMRLVDALGGARPERAQPRRPAADAVDDRRRSWPAFRAGRELPASTRPAARSGGAEEIGAARAASEILAALPGGQRRAGPHARRLGQHVQLRADRPGRPSWAAARCEARLDARQPAVVRPAARGDHDGRSDRPQRLARAGAASSSIRFLEEWYNREGPETPRVRSATTYLFGPREFDYPDLTAAEAGRPEQDPARHDRGGQRD